VVIGKKGADIEKLRKKVALNILTSSSTSSVEARARRPLVAESIAQQPERRVASAAP
jgi:small subunit ribosomal protein S3